MTQEQKVQAVLRYTERHLAKAEREQATRKANQARKDAERTRHLNYELSLGI